MKSHGVASDWMGSPYEMHLTPLGKMTYDPCQTSTSSRIRIEVPPDGGVTERIKPTHRREVHFQESAKRRIA
jgi:hypothetical protein